MTFSYFKDIAAKENPQLYLPAISEETATTPTTVSTPEDAVVSAPKTATASTPETLSPMPTLNLPGIELPDLQLSEGSSVTSQLNKLNSKDSLTNQQAATRANEYGVASGGVHGSQQAGAIQRAMTDDNSELAVAEANRSATQDMSNWENAKAEKVSNWTNQTTAAMETYEKQYTERLSQLGFDDNKQAYMAQTSTSLSNAFLAAITSLTNNTDLDLGQDVYDRFTDIFNTAMDNNNLTLDMGFTYDEV